MTLAPTLASIEALYRKAEREYYRAYHSRNRTPKVDHFFNFCVTAHSLRDYFFERKGIIDQQQQGAYHELWNRDPTLVAAGEIANTSKHFTLRFKSGKPKRPQTKRVRTTRIGFVDVYMSASSQELRFVHVRAPDVSVTLSDGTRYQLYQFMDRILDYWRTYLRNENIRLRRQPFSQLSGRR